MRRVALGARTLKLHGSGQRLHCHANAREGKMRTTSININLDPAKEGKWYAKENVTKRGETTVTFFQRDGKRSFLQKFKDFRNNVHSGTELASKYSKELGLPAEALSNPKNKSEKVTISNDKLNTLFRHTYQKIFEFAIKYRLANQQIDRRC